MTCLVLVVQISHLWDQVNLAELHFQTLNKKRKNHIKQTSPVKGLHSVLPKEEE